MYRWKGSRLEKGKVTKKLVTNWIAYLGLGAALVAMTFFGVCTPNPGQFGPSGAAATVASHEISRNEFQRAYRGEYQRYSRFGDAFDPSKMKLAKIVLDRLVNQRVVFETALEAGIAASTSEVDKQIADYFRDENGKVNLENFEQALKQNGYTERTLQDQVRVDLTVAKYQRLINEVSFVSDRWVKLNFELDETKANLEYLKFTPSQVQVSVTKKEVKDYLANKDNEKAMQAYYDRNRSEYNKEKKVRARHVLIAHKESTNAAGDSLKRDKAAAKALAEKVAKEAKASPANFASLAKKYTDEPSGKTKGGDLGYFSPGDMVKSFSDVAFAMKNGEVSGVVESKFGFHVIKATGIQPEVKKTLDQAKKEIARKLLEQSRRPEILKQRADEVLKSLMAGKSVQGQLRDYKLKWQETKDFSPDTSSIPGIGNNDEIAQVAFQLKAKEVAKKAYEIDGNYYIIRLKSLNAPDFKKLDDQRRDQLAQASSGQQARAVFEAVNKAVESSLKKDGQIWVNDEYLALDNAQTNSGG